MFWLTVLFACSLHTPYAAAFQALPPPEVEQSKPAATREAQPETTIDYAAEGMKALENEKYERAVELFSKAAAADLSDYAAHFHLGFAYSMLQRDPEAIREYRKVLELKPGLYQAQLNLGILLLRNRRPKEALPALEAAGAQKPGEFRPFFYLAEAQFQSGDFAKAAESYGKALELDAKSAPAALGMARSFAKLGRPLEAIPHYRKAAELDPSYRDTLLELATVLESAQQGEEAIALYRQFPDHAAAQERLGELLIETGKPREAILPLEFAVKQSPTAANRLALATAYLRSNETDKALGMLKEALRMEPADTRLRLHYGRVLRDQKNYAAAAEQFEAVARAEPQSVEVWNEVAAVRILLEKYDRALEALDKLKSLGAETASHYYLRALALDHMKVYKPALDNYQAFLAMSRNQHPDEEFKARERIKTIQKELRNR